MFYAGPAHLADGDQSLHAFGDFREGAEFHDSGDANGEPCALGKLLLEAIPGVGLGVSQAQGDSLLIEVDLEDADFDFLSDGEDVLWMFGVRMAHFLHVQKAISAAEINEGTEIGETLYGTLADLTFFEISP